MKYFITLLFLLLISATTTQKAKQHPVLLEFFTSMNCPNCPSAESFMEDLESKTRHADQPVFLVTYHIDYLDTPRSKDPLAKPEFSERQRRYARQYDQDTVYTPQVVINGQEGIAGHERSQIQRAIKSILADQASETEIAITNIERGNDLKINYESKNVPEGAVIHALLLEKSVVLKFNRHVNVVRDVKTVNDKEEIHLPRHLDGKKYIVVIFVQDKDNAVLDIDYLELIKK